jgi:predicted  nucleic acid-binding Zn-ribbon protein
MFLKLSASFGTLNEKHFEMNRLSFNELHKENNKLTDDLTRLQELTQQLEAEKAHLQEELMRQRSQLEVCQSTVHTMAT